MPHVARALLLTATAAVSAVAAADLIANVLAFGADPTGETSSTTAIHGALAALNAAGGGVLYLPRGTYVSGPFNMTSNTALVLDHALLKANNTFAAFSLIPPLPSYGEGRDKLPNDLAGRYEPFIGAYYVRNVSITTNSSGIIHGQGMRWWQAKFDTRTLNNTPPHLFEAGWSAGVSIGAPPGSPRNALILKDSPFWNVHLYDSDDSWVHDVTILADPVYPNTDGVDPDSSRNTLIERIEYVGGDDGVAIKSGWDDAGIRYGVPVEGVVVRDSVFTTVAACVCIGSEMSGGARNVSVTNVTCSGAATGMYAKSSPGRGGYVRNFSFTDSVMAGVTTAFEISLSYGDNPQPPLTFNLSALPVMDGFTFARVRGTGIGRAGSLSGAPGGDVAGITITGVRVEDVALDAPAGSWACTNVTGSSANVVPQPCAAIGGR